MKTNKQFINQSQIPDLPVRLPAEWEDQSFIQLTWPHKNTDWSPMLDEIEDCYIRLADQIAARQPLLIVAPEFPHCLVDKPYADRISFVCCSTNDTWARDHAFITVLASDGTPRLLDFCFNGWGMKFAADKDNLINARVNEAHVLNGEYVNKRGFVLEGGSIESNGKGTILTTTSCLLSENRNDQLSQAEIETMLKQTLGAEKVLWLEHSYLAGDDTDGHIDTVARLCPGNTIVYTACRDTDDEHFIHMRNMERQIRQFTDQDGVPFRTLPLPMPKPVFDSQGNRLPATYANFLVMNNAVLCPAYGDPATEKTALETLAQAFPGREIVSVDCMPLIQQHGSLHCATMQYPKNCRDGTPTNHN